MLRGEMPVPRPPLSFIAICGVVSEKLASGSFSESNPHLHETMLHGLKVLKKPSHFANPKHTSIQHPPNIF